MPKIDMNAYKNAEAYSGESQYQQMEPGGYVVRIQKVVTEWENAQGQMKGADYSNTVMLVYDIDEGDLAGKFSDSYWMDNPSRDKRHCVYLSWTNMGAFKGNVEAIEESNPGFDFMAAFEADKWALLIGKRLGIVVGGREWKGDDGEIRIALELPSIRSVEKIKSGDYKVPPLKKLQQADPVRSADPYSADDIPFN